jgi:hypothetical protein
MTEIKTLVVLDLSDIDNTLIEYASFMQRRLRLRKYTLYIISKKYEISELFEEQLKDINLDEIIGMS